LKSGINKNIYVDVPMKILIRNFRNLPVPFDVERPLVFLNYQERYHTHTYRLYRDHKHHGTGLIHSDDRRASSASTSG
jgi:hypothetical protein